MGQWDRELIELLPDEVKVYASAGAGYDWVDVSCLAEHGEPIAEDCCFPQHSAHKSRRGWAKGSLTQVFGAKHRHPLLQRRRCLLRSCR